MSQHEKTTANIYHSELFLVYPLSKREFGTPCSLERDIVLTNIGRLGLHSSVPMSPEKTHILIIEAYQNNQLPHHPSLISHPLHTPIQRPSSQPNPNLFPPSLPAAYKTTHARSQHAPNLLAYQAAYVLGCVV